MERGCRASLTSSVILGFDPVSVAVYSPGMRIIFLMMTFLVCACEPAPIEVYEEARKARDSKDWDQLMTYFDQNSRDLFLGLDAIYEKTSPKFSYHVRLDKVCSWDDVLSESIEGTRAKIEIGHERNPEPVYFVLEEGSWKIRGCRLDDLWAMP